MSGEVVAICIPAGDSVATFWAHDLARMMTHTALVRPDISLHQVFCTGSLIVKQRETLLNEVLKHEAVTKVTHVLFLDSDMRFPRDTLLRLLAHDVECVAVNYTMRNAPFLPVTYASLEDWNERVWTTDATEGLYPVAATGLGVMLLQVGAIKKMPKPRFMVGYNKELEGYMGEDVYFCVGLQKVGVRVFIDQTLSQEIGHVGRFELTAAHALKWAEDEKIGPFKPKLELVHGSD